MLSRYGLEEGLQTQRHIGTTEVLGYFQNNKAMGNIAPWKDMCLSEGVSCHSTSIGWCPCNYRPCFSNLTQKYIDGFPF